MITVVNKHTHKPTNVDVYIGRGSVLGNPFSHSNNTKARFIVESRERAILCYRLYLYAMIARRDLEVCKVLNKIYLMAKRGDVNLVCYCKPRCCHGDIIREVIEEKL